MTRYANSADMRAAAATPEGAKKEFEQYRREHPSTKKKPVDFYEKPDSKKDTEKERKIPKARAPWENTGLSGRIKKLVNTEVGGRGKDWKFQQSHADALHQHLRKTNDVHDAIDAAAKAGDITKKDKELMHHVFRQQQEHIDETRAERKLDEKKKKEDKVKKTALGNPVARYANSADMRRAMHRPDPEKMDPEAAMAMADGISNEIARKAKEAMDFAHGEILDHQQHLKRIDRAWHKWDWQALEDLSLLSREDAAFMREVTAMYSW